MVSNVTLMYMHLRLQEIFQTDDAENGWFGNKNLLVLGDFLQLPPVLKGRCIFQCHQTLLPNSLVLLEK